MSHSVGQSIRRSIRPSVSALEAISNVTAPAQKHATDDAVYTALFIYEIWIR